VTAAVIGATVAAVPVAPAAAASFPLERCRDNDRPEHGDAGWWSAPGNQHTPWAAPAGLQDEDVLRVSAFGTVRIDFWGTTKSVNGELPVAPTGWPAPGERRYMLIAKVSAGSVWLERTGRFYGPGQWFPIGFDSGCFMYDSAGVTNPQLIFSYNDPNLGDNGGGAGVTVKQWWGIL
jgi:hypothetical protein